MMISTRRFCRSRTPHPVGTSRCVSRSDADREADQWLRDAIFGAVTMAIAIIRRRINCPLFGVNATKQHRTLPRPGYFGTHYCASVPDSRSLPCE